jgi:uncharacterized protein (DUF1697 family)
MAELREHLDAAGWGPVHTYIHSGNILVTSPLAAEEVATSLTATISQRFGFDVPVVVRTPADVVSVASVAASLPTPDRLLGPVKRYVAFLSDTPLPQGVGAVDAWDAPGEWATVVGRQVYLMLSVPFHSMKLTGARLERLLGTSATARDLTVVGALAQRWGTASAAADDSETDPGR